MKKQFKIAALAISMAFAGAAFANDGVAQSVKNADPQIAILAKMASVFGGVEVSSVTKLSDVVDKAQVPVTDKSSSILGLYEVKLANGARIYTDASASFWLLSRQGLDFINTPNDHDVININGIADRGDTLKATKDLGKTIDFIAPNQKAVVTVFVDVQCGYCHKLFDERQSYLDKGITLKFAAAAIFPGSKEVMGQMWCSPTAKKDLLAFEQYETDRRSNPKAKAPSIGDGKTTCNDLIDQQSSIAKKIGLTGTPMIVQSNGDKISGYKSADELAKILGL